MGKIFHFPLHIQVDRNSSEYSTLSEMEKYGWGNLGIAEDNLSSKNIDCDSTFGINPFYIKRGK